jgi:kynurenine formamidase
MRMRTAFIHRNAEFTPSWLGHAICVARRINSLSSDILVNSAMDFTSLLNVRAYDLGQPYFPGMPHFPSHPPFLYSLTKKHGDILYDSGVTSAADAIAMGTHVGTHIDALSHFSCNGVFYGGRRVEHTYEHGMTELGVDTVGPIVRRGVLLDIAGLEGVDVLPVDFEVTSDHLSRAANTEVNEGDIVLLRTGWARFFSDTKRYINNTVAPGPGIEGARWLSSRKIFAAGSDTVVFEKTPSPAMSVHTHLLVESGIHIIEV